MNLNVTEFDLAYLLIGGKKYICTLFSVLSHCDNRNITVRKERVEAFVLNLPREKYTHAPFRISFKLTRHLFTHDCDYFQYKPSITVDGNFVTLLQKFFENDKTMRLVRSVAAVNSLYGL